MRVYWGEESLGWGTYWERGQKEEEIMSNIEGSLWKDMQLNVLIISVLHDY